MTKLESQYEEIARAIGLLVVLGTMLCCLNKARFLCSSTDVHFAAFCVVLPLFVEFVFRLSNCPFRALAPEYT